MKFLLATVVVLATLFIQPSMADARCRVRRAPVRRAVQFFRTNKPVRRALKAVVTAPIRVVKARRLRRCR